MELQNYKKLSLEEINTIENDILDSTKKENLSSEELDQLKDCRTQVEWNKVVDLIYNKRNQNYPPDWYKKVVIPEIYKCVKSIT
jgi:hypothetical protein